jgi:hypothetical protein
MLDDCFVIDSVSHGYHFDADNSKDPEATSVIAGQLYALGLATMPEGALLPWDRWISADDPELVASALFAESRTDAASITRCRSSGCSRTAARRCGWARRCASAGRVGCSCTAA